MQGLSIPEHRAVPRHPGAVLREGPQAPQREVLRAGSGNYLPGRTLMRYESTPLFRSGHEACRFAYAYSGQQYPMTIMAKMMKSRSIGSGRGLVGLEGAAVAGTVKRHVEALRGPLPSVLAAWYEPDRNRAEQHASRLAEYVIAGLGTGAHNRRMVLALICRYFRIPDQNGKPVQLANIASRFDLSQDTITRRWSATRSRLREAHNLADSDIDGALVQSGLVISPGLR